MKPLSPEVRSDIKAVTTTSTCPGGEKLSEIIPNQEIFSKISWSSGENRDFWCYEIASSGAITRATTLISLIKIFKLGPAVSLKGSPTVSPMTAAL